jgi:hypothetical protein
MGEPDVGQQRFPPRLIASPADFRALSAGEGPSVDRLTFLHIVAPAFMFRNHRSLGEGLDGPRCVQKKSDKSGVETFLAEGAAMAVAVDDRRVADRDWYSRCKSFRPASARPKRL